MARRSVLEVENVRNFLCTSSISSVLASERPLLCRPWLYRPPSDGGTVIFLTGCPAYLIYISNQMMDVKHTEGLKSDTSSGIVCIFGICVGEPNFLNTYTLFHLRPPVIDLPLAAAYRLPQEALPAECGRLCPNVGSDPVTRGVHWLAAEQGRRQCGLLWKTPELWGGSRQPRVTWGTDSSLSGFKHLSWKSVVVCELFGSHYCAS